MSFDLLKMFESQGKRSLRARLSASGARRDAIFLQSLLRAKRAAESACEASPRCSRARSSSLRSKKNRVASSPEAEPVRRLRKALHNAHTKKRSMVT